jgi:hypothetical protein
LHVKARVSALLFYLSSVQLEQVLVDAVAKVNELHSRQRRRRLGAADNGIPHNILGLEVGVNKALLVEERERATEMDGDLSSNSSIELARVIATTCARCALT